MSTSPQGQSGYAPPPPRPSLPYASFWQRLGAAVLDGLILLLVYAVLFGVLWGLFTILEPVSMNAATAAVVLLGIAVYIGSLIWLMLLEAGPYGQTLGKRLLNIRVVDAYGRPISKGSSVGRFFAKYISQLPLYLGFLWPLWDAERRTFHDMILDTRVIRADDSPPLGQIVTAPFRRRNAT